MNFKDQSIEYIESCLHNYHPLVSKAYLAAKESCPDYEFYARAAYLLIEAGDVSITPDILAATVLFGSENIILNDQEDNEEQFSLLTAKMLNGVGILMSQQNVSDPNTPSLIDEDVRGAVMTVWLAIATSDLEMIDKSFESMDKETMRAEFNAQATYMATDPETGMLVVNITSGAEVLRAQAEVAADTWKRFGDIVDVPNLEARSRSVIDRIEFLLFEQQTVSAAKQKQFDPRPN